MKKIFLFVLSFVPLLSYGQLDLNKAFEAFKRATEEKPMVDVAVIPELYIIRQQYRLLRDGKAYGKNHKPYFGESYSLGIKVSNGTLLLNSVVEPWLTDEEYSRLNSSGQYTPELFRTYQRNINSSDYNEVNLEFGTDYIHPFDSKKKIYIHEEKKGDFGLSIDNSPGLKDGFMIWINSGSNLQDSTMSVNVKSKPLRITASEDNDSIVLEDYEPNIVLGGLFVVPKYERGGRISIQIVGIAIPELDNKTGTSGNKWGLALLTKGIAEINNKAHSQSALESNDSELTPIATPEERSDKKEKKKKK